MTLDDVLTALFGDDHVTERHGALVTGRGTLPTGVEAHLVGIGDRAELGVEDALFLAARVLAIVDEPGDAPILFLLDSSSQRMSRRDELLGLNEFLAHLAKALLLAERAGHETIGLLYGGSAAGALIATALACGALVALAGAYPEVMDLPSMARVTKLPLEILKAKAETTPVFAPGLHNLAQTGAIAEIWDRDGALAEKLSALLQRPRAGGDARAKLGAVRGGRPKAADIADRVVALAVEHG